MRVLYAWAPEDGSLIGKWMSGMSPEKRSRIQRMRRDKDIFTAIAAHRLLCFALKSAYGIEPLPDDWAVGEYGKPYLKDLSGVHFNISHSGNMAMCVLHEKPVGADIELVRPPRPGLEQKIMSESERQVFSRCDDKVKFFYRVWTLKESYMKYTGCGLGALGEITVLPGEAGIISNVKGCRFASIDRIPGYQSAVCAGAAGFAEPPETGGFLGGDDIEIVAAGALNSF